jgi:DNA-directed RNA polymerase sigma subunit (sigma70/sigma32)
MNMTSKQLCKDLWKEVDHINKVLSDFELTLELIDELVTLRKALLLQIDLLLTKYSDGTFDSMAGHFGVTRERLRQIETAALRKLASPKNYAVRRIKREYMVPMESKYFDTTAKRFKQFYEFTFTD